MAGSAPRPLLALSFGLATLLAGACGPAADEDAGSTAGEERPLRPVTMPPLEGFSAAVREQIEAQLDRVRAAKEANRTDELAESYGTLGKLLLAYDLSRAAEPALLNAAALDPDDARWHYYLAHLSREEGYTDRAVGYLERTLELDPEYTPARTGLAVLYRDLGREREAAALVNETLRDDADNAVAHLVLGHLAATDDPRQAIEHFETVLRLQPDASIVRYPLAIAYRRVGDLDRSREHLKERGSRSVRMRDPLIDQLEELRRGAGAKIARGTELAVRGQLAEAARQFEAALAEDSSSAFAHLDLAITLAQIGELTRAKEHLERALAIDSSNTHALYSLGLVLLLSDAPEQAADYFRRAIAADPGNSQARLALGDLLWRRGECREAIAAFTAFLAEQPGNIEARIQQAICHAHVGECSLARYLLEAGYEAWPDDPRLQNALIRTLAASPDSAVRDGERALALAEKLAGSYRQVQVFESLAMAYAEQGRFEEAVHYQQQVLAAAEAQNVARELLDHLREHLRLYRRGRPSRTPWPPTVFGE